MRCDKYDIEVANSYDLDRKEEEHWTLENEYVQNRYKNKSIVRLLDMPVGTGRFLQYYQNVNEIIGIDISEHMLSEAEKKINPLMKNITLLKGDAFNLNFKDNYFDDIVCFRLLHLIPKDLRLDLFLEMQRVSQTIILQVYIDKKISFFVRIINKFKRIFISNNTNSIKPWAHIEAYGLSKSELNKLLKNSDLNVVKSTCLCDYMQGEVFVYELSKTKN